MSKLHYDRYKTSHLQDLIEERKTLMDIIKTRQYLPDDYRTLYVEEIQNEIETMQSIIDSRKEVE